MDALIVMFWLIIGFLLLANMAFWWFEKTSQRKMLRDWHSNNAVLNEAIIELDNHLLTPSTPVRGVYYGGLQAKLNSLDNSTTKISRELKAIKEALMEIIPKTIQPEESLASLETAIAKTDRIKIIEDYLKKIN